LFDTDIAKIYLKLQGGIPGATVRSRGYHGAHADVEFLKLIKGRHA